MDVFLDEVRKRNQEEFERIDRLMKVLDTFAEEETTIITYSITSGNQ